MAPAKRASASVVRAALKELRAATGWTPSDLVSVLRGGGSSGKGGEYEREMCKRISLWWTDGGRDDVFWRSSGSGARAKVRGRAGTATYGQHGDVAATDPVGTDLVDAFTIEIKRGYSQYTIQDVVDRPGSAGVQPWEVFFDQAIESHEQAGSVSWLLITRRDRREALVWAPADVFKKLRFYGAFRGGKPWPFVGIGVVLRCKGKPERRVAVRGVLLSDWFKQVPPEVVRRFLGNGSK